LQVQWRRTEVMVKVDSLPINTSVLCGIGDIAATDRNAKRVVVLDDGHDGIDGARSRDAPGRLTGTEHVGAFVNPPAVVPTPGDQVYFFNRTLQAPPPAPSVRYSARPLNRKQAAIWYKTGPELRSRVGY